ncbi:MAG TPA: glycosyltransferase 87 family protein [Solirubrobacteraceae bacterium]
MRENVLCAFMATLGCATMAWLGLYGFGWNDYDNEARPAFDALVHGHLLDFLRLAPGYGGSLVERAPFALIPGLWGGGELSVYRLVALPCLLAAAAFAVWLLASMRAQNRSTLARAVALGICVANPLTLRALELGHPEELLGACLCVAAVVLAGRDRPLWAGLALGLAFANKEWALLAAGPVLLALPAGHRLRCVLGAGGVAAAILAPLTLVSSGGFTAGARGLASSPGMIFQPWQVWWFLGHHGALVHGLFGAPKPGYRAGPAWVGSVSHPLVILAGLVLTVALWWQLVRALGRSSRLPERDALLALALLLLLRCVLDSWDAIYYPLPFVFALLAWETQGSVRSGAPRDLPVLALSSTALVWINFQWLPDHQFSPDAQAAFFLAWSLAFVTGLGVRLYAGDRTSIGRRRYGLPSGDRQEMTVSSLPSRLRIS